MQHELFINPSARFRAAFPFVAELQADIAEGRERMVAPLVRVADMSRSPGRLSPIVQFDGQRYYLTIHLMGLLPRSRLAKPVGSIATYRDEITRAIDWLFTGI